MIQRWLTMVQETRGKTPTTKKHVEFQSQLKSNRVISHSCYLVKGQRQDSGDGNKGFEGGISMSSAVENFS